MRSPPSPPAPCADEHLRAEGLGLELGFVRARSNDPLLQQQSREPSPFVSASSFASQGFCCEQGGDNSVFIDFVRITAMAIKGVIEIPNPSFEENPEVASCEWTLSPLP